MACSLEVSGNLYVSDDSSGVLRVVKTLLLQQAAAARWAHYNAVVAAGAVSQALAKGDITTITAMVIISDRVIDVALSVAGTAEQGQEFVRTNMDAAGVWITVPDTASDANIEYVLIGN